jgi:hypothetical protein
MGDTMTKEQHYDLSIFLTSLDGVEWMAHAGESHPSWIVVADSVEGVDGWNVEMMNIWSPRIHRLEQWAIATLSNTVVDEIFATTSEYLGQLVSQALQSYFDRRPSINENTECSADFGLWPEMLDSIKRDVAWAAMEHVLHEPEFFTDLLAYYRAGRWPCSWDGEYPDGTVVVL